MATDWTTPNGSKLAEFWPITRLNNYAVGAQNEGRSQSDTLADLMLKNLSEDIGGEGQRAPNGRDQEPLFRGRSLLRSERFEAPDTQSATPLQRRGDCSGDLGPAGSPPVVNGMDVAQFKDGRIRSLSTSSATDDGH